MKILQYFVLLGVLLLSACGDKAIDNTKTGYFRDSAVKGLNYKTLTQQGITDELGGYRYQAGEIITFSLGSLVLGSATASAALYPHNIAKNYEDSIRIAQLLQTLDSDNNADNGIDVTGQFTGTDTALPEHLTQDYINNNAKNGQTLVTREAAQTHLAQTRAKYQINNAPATIHIKGDVVQDTLLTTHISDIGGVPSNGITYQWYINNTIIDGANSSRLMLTQNQAGKRIKVRALFTDLMGATETPESDPITIKSMMIGYFKGSAVKGLNYTTNTQNGITDTSGKYQYIPGEHIKFYLGDLYLGQSLATKVLYPSDIANSTRTMIKIAQLLQTLDADSNPSNGIDVSRFSASTRRNYLPDADLSQQDHINKFDSSKTLVSKTDAENFLINAIANDRNTDGYIGIAGNAQNNYDFYFSSAGVREFEIATLACAQVGCCTASIINKHNAIIDQNRVIRLNTSQQAGQSVTLVIQPLDLDSQTCYYKPPIASDIEPIANVKKTISAQGDGNSHPTLDVVKVNQHYYLQDNSRDATITTLKSIGLSSPKYTEHTATMAKNLDKDGVDAHANSIKTYDYLKNVLGINSYDNNNGPLSATTNFLIPRSLSSPGPPPGSRYNAFYSGGGIYYTPAKPSQGYDKSLSSIVNVAAHEWGHAVTNKASNLVYERESGAMNEAFSDWLGISIEQHYSTGTKSWLIGFPDKPFRSMSHPSSLGKRYAATSNYKILKNGQVHTPDTNEVIPYPDTYKGENWLVTDTANCPKPNANTNDSCGVHFNSSVANKMFYLLSVGGTHNSITVTGIGIDNAMKIALDANRTKWTSSTTFHNAKTGMIDVSKNYGQTDTGVNMQQQVRLAWEAVNVLDSNR